jgi:hypothetical protein
MIVACMLRQFHIHAGNQFRQTPFDPTPTNQHHRRVQLQPSSGGVFRLRLPSRATYKSPLFPDIDLLKDSTPVSDAAAASFCEALKQRQVGPSQR